MQAGKRLLPAHKLVPAVSGAVPVRRLNLHEYQSKTLMEQYGCNTQRFKIATSTQEAETVTSELGVEEVVVKAQILAGGRGKGVFSSGLQGGVKVTKE
jgi:succinyl-CoA synthetase beta subunit